MNVNDIVKRIKHFERRIKDVDSLTEKERLQTLPFIDLLYYFMDRRYPGEKDSFLYNKAQIDAKLFSKIRKPDYHPSRKAAIALGLALELDFDDFELLLRSAHYSLSLNSRFDLVIIYCIGHQIYDLYTVYDILYTMNLL